MSEQVEILIADLIYCRIRKAKAKTELEERTFSGMVTGLEGALKVLDVDIEKAILEYDLKYDR
jgi:hypothetical protein